MLHETKRFLSRNFKMKDLGDASFVLGIQIHRDRSRGILGLSQISYIKKVLKRFGMQECKSEILQLLRETSLVLNSTQKEILKFRKCKRFPMHQL